MNIQFLWSPSVLSHSACCSGTTEQLLISVLTHRLRHVTGIAQAGNCACVDSFLDHGLNPPGKTSISLEIPICNAQPPLVFIQ